MRFSRVSFQTALLAVVLAAAWLCAFMVPDVMPLHAATPPAPLYVPAGGDAKAAVATGRPVYLARGATFAGPLKLKPGQVLSSYGTGLRPQIVASGANDNGITCDAGGGAGPRVSRVAVLFTGKLGNSTGRGIQILNANGSQVLDTWVFGFRMGLTCEAYGGRRCNGLELRGNVLMGSRQPVNSTQHSAGAYISYTDNAVIEGNTFDANGTAAANAKFNHDLYFHGSNGPGQINFNTFAAAASYGLQQRAGGSCVGNLFLGNPIEMSYGYVNGEMIFPGGVRGEIAWNAYLGSSRQSDGEARGWAIDLANLAGVSVHDILLEGDAESYATAISLKPGTGVTNESQQVPPERWGVTLTRLYVDWPGGKIYDVRGKASAAAVLAPPAGQRGDALRALGGYDAVLDVARRDPRNAAKTAIPIAFKARGLPMPPWYVAPTPSTQPATKPAPPPPPPPPETLEQVIRTRPQDLRAAMENGKPILKAGSAPSWGVAGDVVTRN